MFTPYDRDSELYHWGILGMHWGIRRFQPYPKGYKGSGKEVGQAARKPRKRKLSKEAQKRAKMRSEAANLKAQTQLDAARAEAAEARQYADMAERANNYRPKKSLFKTMSKDAKRELKKEKAIRSGDPKKVQRYKKLMTTEEYREAVARCSMTMDLELQSLQKVSKIGETIASGASSAARIGQSALSIQNSIADVHNAISKSGEKWKKWGEKDDSGEKAWTKKKREWEEEDRKRKQESEDRAEARAKEAYEREKERYERDKYRSEKEEAWNRYKTMFEYGFDPDSGMRLKDMPDDTLYKVFDDYRTKNKRGMSDDDFEKMLKRFGVSYSP